MLSMKMILVGDSCVGKSSLLQRFVNRKFYAYSDPTIEECYQILVEVDGLNHSVEVLDTSGIKEFNALRQMYYRNKDVVNIMFSVVDSESFENVNNDWLPEVRNYFPNIPILLVGNMIDMRNDAQNEPIITTKMGEKLAQEINAFKYIECSCKTGAGVSNVFQQSVRAVKRCQRVKEAIKNPKALRKKTYKSEKFETCSIISSHDSDVIDPPVVAQYY